MIGDRRWQQAHHTLCFAFFLFWCYVWPCQGGRKTQNNDQKSSLSLVGRVQQFELEQRSARSGCQLEEGGRCHERSAAETGYPNNNLFRPFPRIAKCCVQGLPIDELEPSLNFRRAFSLGMTKNVEDAQHLLSFLRASKDLAMSRKTRRILIDLGGHTFQSSVEWFLKYYPLDFTEIYVFEAKPGFFRIPRSVTLRPLDVVKNMNGASRVQGIPSLPDWPVDRIHLFEKFVHLTDEPGCVNVTTTKLRCDTTKVPGCINITRFIKEELKLYPQDDAAVVVKMDIEDTEWEVLPKWMEDPEMPFIVDELFVEVHYNHSSMKKYGWTSYPHTREQAYDLFVGLRDKHFYVHPWP